jgi:hypothetical protein
MFKPLSINIYKCILFLLPKQKKARNKPADRLISKKTFALAGNLRLLLRNIALFLVFT